VVVEAIGRLLDPFCIALYWGTGVPILDYLMGTFLLALACVVIGEFTMSVLFRMNRPYLADQQGEMVRMHNLSLEALKNKDKAGYTACNMQANESHGKVFFNMVTLSAAALWPAFFALAWMQYRFQGVTLEVAGLGLDLAYSGSFILMYILARILFKYLKPHLPYFRAFARMIRMDADQAGRMRSLGEVFSTQELERKQR
jgi:hypothetical protein